ncbi:hypothetical protein Tco_1169680 [Tanacetum coccineum]
MGTQRTSHQSKEMENTGSSSTTQKEQFLIEKERKARIHCKEKLNVSIVHNNWSIFGYECKFKGSKEGSRQEAGRGQDFKPVRTEKKALMTIDEGQINWVEQTTDEELNHALMASTNE